MDHHLNLYYSYSQGKRDQESERILENNVTRALLITLKGSNTFRKILFNEIEKQILEKYKNRRLRFFSKDKDAQSNNFFYDLQGFNKQYLNNKRIESWIMLKLSPISSGICDTTNSRDDVKELYDLMDSKEKNEKEIQERVEKFRTLLRNQENKLPNEETSEIRNCIDYCERKGLPDGWIIDFCNLIGICVENKIFGSCTRSQIDRHKKYIRTNIDKSFKVSDIYEVEFTWEDIENLLNNIELRENTIENFLTNNLKEYLQLTNLTPNISFVLTDGYERNKAREQFKLLCLKLDYKIKGIIPCLERRGRPLSDHIWDYYGIKRTVKRKVDDKENKSNKDINSKEITTDPHYSVYFDADGAGIELTTKDSQLMKSMLSSTKLREFIVKTLKTENSLIPRYYINLNTTSLFDFKKHAQKGEKFNTFHFSINFRKLLNIRTNERESEIKKILSDMGNYIKFSKQCALGLTIRYPKKSKIENGGNDDYILSNENASLFKCYERLLEVYEKFINETKDVFLEINDERVRIDQRSEQKRENKILKLKNLV